MEDKRQPFGMPPIEAGKEITVERWLRRMWLDPVGKRKTKPRRALTVVNKKQGVAVLLVDEKEQWDACTKLAENPDTNEATMAFYRKIKDLQTKVRPGVDRVMVVPIKAWKTMTGSNLFISQFKKKEDEDDVVEGLPDGALSSPTDGDPGSV